jgi:hypothetical protein
MGTRDGVGLDRAVVGNVQATQDIETPLEDTVLEDMALDDMALEGMAQLVGDVRKTPRTTVVEEGTAGRADKLELDHSHNLDKAAAQLVVEMAGLVHRHLAQCRQVREPREQIHPELGE